MTGEISWLVEVKRGTSSLTAAGDYSGRAHFTLIEEWIAAAGCQLDTDVEG
jgi:hypothetical protein